MRKLAPGCVCSRAFCVLKKMPDVQDMCVGQRDSNTGSRKLRVLEYGKERLDYGKNEETDR